METKFGNNNIVISISFHIYFSVWTLLISRGNTVQEHKRKLLLPLQQQIYQW